MVALDPGHVDHARRATQQRAAGESQLRHRLPAALGDRAGAIGDALAALQHFGDGRVMLEPLEFHVGEQMRVLVVQVNDEADVNLIVLQMIHEGSAAGVGPQRPAHRMRDLTQLVLGRVDLPDLLHADAVFLNVGIGVELPVGDGLLGQRPAHALREEDVFAVKLHPWLITRTRRSVLLLAELARDNALQLAILAQHQFGTGHAGEDLHAQLFGVLRHPAADIAHRDDVVAVVVHQRRHREVRDAHLARRAEHQEPVFRHRRVERRAALFPVGDQSIQTAGVQHCARKDMRADLGALFQHDHVQVGVELFQPDRRAQARRARADDDDVIFHRFAFDLAHLACLSAAAVPLPGPRQPAFRLRGG